MKSAKRNSSKRVTVGVGCFFWLSLILVSIIATVVIDIC